MDVGRSYEIMAVTCQDLSCHAKCRHVMSGLTRHGSDSVALSEPETNSGSDSIYVSFESGNIILLYGCW